MKNRKQRIFLLEILLVFLSLLDLGFASTNAVDVAALNALRESFNDPLGHLKTWRSGDPCDSGWDGVICDSGHVTELHLLNYNLSGPIAPEAGNLSNLHILNFMWNSISGSIPPTLGKLQSLELLLLSGNQLKGPIPPEIGNLGKMNRFQIDENQISGPIPSTFGNLSSVKHLHMNNNSLTGSIPPELGKLPTLFHLLLDNNELSGELPPELANISTFEILQLDNNKFDNATLPASYSNIKTLLKMSLRNCNLHGNIPDLSRLSLLEYIDLSNNQFDGEIPSSPALTTIDISNNVLTGGIPFSLTNVKNLQALLLKNNKLNGSIPTALVVRKVEELVLDFQQNSLDGFDTKFDGKVGDHIDLWLAGNNKICDGKHPEFSAFCSPRTFSIMSSSKLSDVIPNCDPTVCVPGQSELVPKLAIEGQCKCASPILVTCRLKSPSFLFFNSTVFENYMAEGLNLSPHQLYVSSYAWEPGPRLLINLKLFSVVTDKNRSFNSSAVLRIFQAFTGWKIMDSPLFGPRELVAFVPPFGIDLYQRKSSGNKNQKTAIIVGILVGCLLLTVIVVGGAVLYVARKSKLRGSLSRRSILFKGDLSLKIEGVRSFSLKEMRIATDSFSKAMEIGRGGYGKVYKGLLDDKQVVAIKRAEEGSYQGEKEFFTEIELLSRIHHRNLVSLIGYCVDYTEQMLVYEFVAGGTLQERLSPIAARPLNFKARIYVALSAARGILYLHTEANPPIIHRDIKATNILLDEKNSAKVADFGLSRLAPEEDGDGVFGNVSTVVKGTPGYLDPEYFLTRKLSDKSDIYSFGVVLLEIITGRQAIYQGKNLVREVKQSYEAGISLSIVDPYMGTYPSEALEPLVRLALACTKDSAEERPGIRKVVRDVEGIWQMIPHFDEDENQNSFRRDGSKEQQQVKELMASSSSSNLDISRDIGPVMPR